MNKTICVNCKHHINLSKNEWVGDAWWNAGCKAYPREKTIDNITGETTYVLLEVSGGKLLTNQPYRLCEHINKGNCPKFEEKSIHKSNPKPEPKSFFKRILNKILG